MENQNNNQPPTYNRDDDSLEAQTTVVENSANGSADVLNQSPTQKAPKQSKLPKPLQRLFQQFNIYVILFGFIILIAVAIVVISLTMSKQNNESQASNIETQSLSEEALAQLRQSDVKVGTSKQILSVESNAIFAGKVLIRDSLEVAGEIKASGSLSIPNLNVSGTASFGQLQVNQLQVAGGATIQGAVAIQNNLAVSGSGNFAGGVSASSINTQNLQISGDLQFNRHIDASGGSPNKADGSALGGGGTSSVSGTDTAGTISINTGGGTSAGCYTTITFNQRFNGTPHVVITPVGAAAARLEYYINRSNTNFSICSANAAQAGQSFAFDYIVID